MEAENEVRTDFMDKAGEQFDCPQNLNAIVNARRQKILLQHYVCLNNDSEENRALSSVYFHLQVDAHKNLPVLVNFKLSWISLPNENL